MIYRFGRFELDEAARELRRGGSEINLQPLVFDLLATLVRNHARVLSKDELLAILWPDVTVTESSLQRAISVARSALGDGSHDLIRTFTGYGYRFRGDVVAASGPVAGAAPAPPVAAEPAPEVHYAVTDDGVDIAYWMLGEGPPLVYVPNLIWSHGRLQWEYPEIRRWYQRLARGRQIVRLDLRGTGSSQREIESYSISDVQRDVEAVVDRLGLDRFALFGDLNGGVVAMRYAAAHPRRVSRLVLWHPFANARGIEGPKLSMLESLQPLMGEDWETYTETRAHMGSGWSDGESAHRYAALLRQCVEPEMARRSYEAIRAADVTPWVPRIAAPTLVLHRRHFYFWDAQVSRDLAASIPDARLVVLDGAGSAPFLGDADGVVAAIEGFGV
jgi:pimeloyl-ACP methyl ester carboxylesterase